MGINGSTIRGGELRERFFDLERLLFGLDQGSSGGLAEAEPMTLVSEIPAPEGRLTAERATSLAPEG